MYILYITITIYRISLPSENHIKKTYILYIIYHYHRHHIYNILQPVLQPYPSGYDLLYMGVGSLLWFLATLLLELAFATPKLRAWLQIRRVDVPRGGGFFEWLGG